jgi:hypothetical protein
MSTGGLEQLEAAICALEFEELSTVSRDELLRLEQLRTRLEAQVTRRLGVFDATYEWAADNKKSLAHWLRAYCHAGKSAYARASVARQVREMPLVEAAWQAGTISSEHVALLARVRRNVKDDDRFGEFEATFVHAADTSRPKTSPTSPGNGATRSTPNVSPTRRRLSPSTSRGRCTTARSSTASPSVTSALTAKPVATCGGRSTSNTASSTRPATRAARSSNERTR